MPIQMAQLKKLTKKYKIADVVITPFLRVHYDALYAYRRGAMWVLEIEEKGKIISRDVFEQELEACMKVLESMHMSSLAFRKNFISECNAVGISPEDAEKIIELHAG